MLALLLLLLSTLCLAAEVPPATEGTLILSDDFERAELGAWRVNCQTFTVADGVLRGSQTRADHGAVGAVKAAFRDGVVEFKFQLAGATGIHAVFDDKAFQGSHAGHLCRVTITPRVIRLGDDKEGGMRNDIYAMRKDPLRKAEGDRLVAARLRAFPTKIEPGRWYRMKIEIVGDTMRVSLDGKPVGEFQSPGFAHPTKSDFHFTVSGRDALFDEVRLWRVEG